MPIVEYTPKASLLAMPYTVRFLADEYAIEIREGANDLSDRDYAHLQSNPDVKTIYKDVIHFKGKSSGSSQSVQSTPTIESTPTLPPADLSEIKGDDLDLTIDSTTDIPTLERWLAAEQRTTVKRKLNERIAELKGG